jgi:hypothetical protein
MYETRKAFRGLGAVLQGRSGRRVAGQKHASRVERRLRDRRRHRATHR